MKIKLRAQLHHTGQDGALWGDLLFRFNANGHCCVFDAAALDTVSETPVTLPRIAEFWVGKNEPVVPHFNAVVFGCEFYAEGDEFPLLYANIYNNYAKAEDRLEGVCCVYRLERDGGSFKTTLVQLIRIGFAQDKTLWMSDGEQPDVRPYGNFVIDREKKLLHAFVMRDAPHTTRYFSFALPKLADGAFSERFGVRVVTLMPEDIKAQFDVPYHHFIQGACLHSGRIYSSEGFNEKIHPALRVIDPAEQRQLAHIDLVDNGYTVEAEWIDFRGETCYYCDAHGDIFEVEFDL